MVRLLNQADWGEDRGRIQRLKGWVYYPLLLEAYDTLQEEALFPSAIHGPGPHPPGASPLGPGVPGRGGGGEDGPPGVPGGQLPRRGPHL